MSTVENNVAVAEAPHEQAGHNHDPHLAHHFDTPEQQFQTGKLGMWVFLATELLMFGGLFCGYSVYRHNHPDVFAYGHQYLDRNLGATNTLVLITSSLTMAWAVRAAQLGQRNLLVGLLALTFLGGLGFMGIKSIEYSTKWKEQIFIGPSNRFFPAAVNTTPEVSIRELEEHALHAGDEPKVAPVVVKATPEPADPNAGTPDEARIKPPNLTPAGLAPEHARAEEHEKTLYSDLDTQQQHRVYTFFGIYFFMTGLHGVHVLVGMGLIAWIIIRSLRGEFGPTYFLPVDLVGLYWHLVDLIWIFLFPLLYLIH
jgi:cytochrome c oxidase subunit 3